VIGPLLALAAAVALNGSYLLQHAGSVHAVAISPLRPVRTFASLLRSPLWTVGAAAGLSGWALHVVALRHAPLSVVQAFVAGGLALTVPAGALALRQRLSVEERQALALMVAALLALALGLPSTRAGRTFSPPALCAWTVALGAIAAALALRANRARAAALGVAGGLLYGSADLAIKALTSLPDPVSPRGAPWLAVAAVATAGAFFAFQRGLQGPRPVPVIALMTTATNLSSILGAFVVFGDPLGRTPAIALLHGLAFALVAASACRLAPAQARLAGRA
jgi:multidrug transporter EmrE-like cation transporter